MAEIFPPLGIPQADRLRLAMRRSSPSLIVALAPSSTYAEFVRVLQESGVPWLAFEPVDNGHPIKIAPAVTSSAQAVVCTSDASVEALKEAIGGADTCLVPWPVDARRFRPIKARNDQRAAEGLDDRFVVGMQIGVLGSGVLRGGLATLGSDTTLLVNAGTSRGIEGLEGSDHRMVQLPPGAAIPQVPQLV